MVFMGGGCRWVFKGARLALLSEERAQGMQSRERGLTALPWQPNSSAERPL